MKEEDAEMTLEIYIIHNKGSHAEFISAYLLLKRLGCNIYLNR